MVESASCSQTTDLITAHENADILVLDIPEITNNLFTNSNVDDDDPSNLSLLNNSSEHQQNEKVSSSPQLCGLIEIDKESDYEVCYNLQEIQEKREDNFKFKEPKQFQMLQEETIAGEERINDNSVINEPDPENDEIPISLNDDESVEPLPKRRKRHLVNRNTWKQSINQTNREKGKEYLGRKKVDDVWTTIPKKNRTIRPRCECKLSKKKTKSILQCDKFTEEERNLIFTKFWNDMNWEQRKTFVYMSVKNQETKRHRNRKDENSSRRQFSSIYFLNKHDNAHRVCKKMFLNTIGMGERMINIWKYTGTNKMNHSTSEDASVENEEIYKPKNVSIYISLKKCLREFFEQIPKVEAHYCRSSSKKKYVEPTWVSKSELYKCYKEVWCKKKNTGHLI